MKFSERGIMIWEHCKILGNGPNRYIRMGGPKIMLSCLNNLIRPSCHVHPRARARPCLRKTRPPLSHSHAWRMGTHHVAAFSLPFSKELRISLNPYPNIAKAFPTFWSLVSCSYIFVHLWHFTWIYICVYILVHLGWFCVIHSFLLLTKHIEGFLYVVEKWTSIG